MKNKLLFSVAVLAIISTIFLGCSNPSGGGGGGGTKPAKLSNSTATYDEALAKCDEILAYSKTPETVKTSVEFLKETMISSASIYRSQWSNGYRNATVTSINSCIDLIP